MLKIMLLGPTITYVCSYASNFLKSSLAPHQLEVDLIIQFAQMMGGAFILITCSAAKIPTLPQGDSRGLQNNAVRTTYVAIITRN